MAEYAINKNKDEVERFAIRKALEYSSKKRVKTSPEKLFTLFKYYREAENSGKMLSLKDMGDASKLGAIHVSMILKSVGLGPFYGTKGRNLTSK